MYELMNMTDLSHSTLSAQNLLSAIDEAKSVSDGDIAIIDNRSMNIVFRFYAMPNA